MNTTIPKSLRIWFIIHFIVDMLFAVPLIVAPVFILTLFGFPQINVLTARLVGAALVGIGGASFFARDMGIEGFQILLTLKILWSGSAILSIVLSIIDGGPVSYWLFLGIFSVFSVLWISYKVRLRKI